MVLLTATIPEVYVATITTFISNSYGSLEETINRLSSLKLKIYLEENVTNFCAEILVDSERISTYGYFKIDHLGYISCIYEDTSDTRICLW